MPCVRTKETYDDNYTDYVRPIRGTSIVYTRRGQRPVDSTLRM